MALSAQRFAGQATLEACVSAGHRMFHDVATRGAVDLRALPVWYL